MNLRPGPKRKNSDPAGKSDPKTAKTKFVSSLGAPVAWANNIIGIAHDSTQQPRRHMVNVYLHIAPLRFSKIEIPLEASAAWKLLKKQLVARHISKRGLDYYYISIGTLLP